MSNNLNTKMIRAYKIDLELKQPILCHHDIKDIVSNLYNLPDLSKYDVYFKSKKLANRALHKYVKQQIDCLKLEEEIIKENRYELENWLKNIF